MTKLLGGAVVAVLIGACSVERLPVSLAAPGTSASDISRPRSPDVVSPAVSRSPPVWEPPSPEPDPTAPSEALPTTASVERDGVRLTIELERNPLGEPTWLSSEVTNIGRDNLIWFHDGCAIAVGVNGPLDGAVWRPGRDHEGTAAEFKEHVLRDFPETAPVWIQFTPERFVGRGSFGCADIGIADTIRPGGSIRERSQWNGMAFPALGLVPRSGPVMLGGTFRYYWRESKGEPEDITSEMIEVELPTWVDRGDLPALVHPMEAIDIALGDPRFMKAVDGRNIGDGNVPVLRFNLESYRWEVGLLDHRRSKVHLVVIDPASGAIVDYVERPWDYQSEGIP